MKEETFQNVAGQTYVGNQYRGNTTHPRGSSNLVSDGSGVIEGSFLLPNNDSLRFKQVIENLNY